MRNIRRFIQAQTLILGKIDWSLLSVVSAAPVADLSTIYMCRGADRERRLIQGDRKEGTLSLYTSINTKDLFPIVDAFQKKYQIKV